MLEEFLLWWGRQLLSLWPRGGAGQRGDALVATLRDGGSVEVGVRRGGKAGSLGSFPPTEAGLAALAGVLGSRRPPAELRLPPGRILQQTVTLPLAAERDLARVLHYEMDRLTPFAEGDLHWTFAVERRDRGRSLLEVRLWLVLRSQVAATLEWLRRAGLSPAVLRDAAGDGAAIPLDVARTGAWQRHGAAVLAAACAVLAVAAVAIPFMQQADAADRVEREIADLRPAVDRADALRRGMAAAAAGVDVLATQRAKVGDPLAVLAALTEILPDDTVLTDLSLRQRIITISGQSAAAARLIPALAADPALRDPAFTAPVTRNETLHSDGFTIRAAAASPSEAAQGTRR